MTDSEPDISDLIKHVMTSHLALVSLVEQLGTNTDQVSQAVLQLVAERTSAAAPSDAGHERRDRDCDDDDRPVFDTGQRQILEEYDQLRAALGRTDLPFYVSAEAEPDPSGKRRFQVTVTGSAVAQADTIRLVDGPHTVQTSATTATFWVEAEVADTPVRVLANRRVIAVGTVRLVTPLQPPSRQPAS